jgi:hypothetical protein
MASAVKKNPEKWKRIVASVKAGSKGGKPGEWSAVTQKHCSKCYVLKDLDLFSRVSNS